MESLCIPPMSRTSLLSKYAIQLLSSGQATDMVFEVVASQGLYIVFFYLLVHYRYIDFPLCFFLQINLQHLEESCSFVTAY